METPKLSIPLETIVAARRRLEQYQSHLDVALSFRRALSAPTRVDELGDAVEIVALTVIETCQRMRGADPTVVAAAVTRLDQACMDLESLCRQLALTEASA